VIDAVETAERAVAAAEADEAEAVVLAERSGFARFAGSEVHQPTLVEDASVSLRVVVDGKVGIAATNDVGEAGLRRLARRAAESAGARASDSLPGLPDPEPLPAVAGYDADTAALEPDDQARLAAAAIDASALPVYGYFTSGVTELAVASSRGVRAAQTLTDATALVIAAGDDASGYAEQTAWRASEIDPAAVAREAEETARRTQGAHDLEAGRYAAVLDRYALAELLVYFSYDSLGALGLLEERSYFCSRLGERVFDPKVSIADDALDPAGLPKAFDFEGVPKRRVELVEAGVARDVVWDRETAAQAGDGHASTGHAPAPLEREWGPLPLALSVKGGDASSTEELAELVGDGIYITRLHYLSVVDPREGVITGMTRDGTFRIRNGRVAEPLVNLRFTVSVPDVLTEVPGLTREPRIVNVNDFYGVRYPFGLLAPALATAHFHVTGTGSRPGI
jgi:predicted Zn-dependent protease